MRNSLFLTTLCILSFNLMISAHTNDSDLIKSDSTTTDSVVAFSHPAGFYNSTFTLSLTAPLTSDSICYTLDGSNPYTSSDYYVAGNQTQITINPDSQIGRGKTPAVVVKASIIRNNTLYPHPLSQTYIFINKVSTQAYPGGTWPSAEINSQVIDYEMDQDVVTNSSYSDLITPGLLSLPAISVSTDNENLFDKSTGIYVNAGNRGDEWERECSAELIYPDGSQGFSVNAGLRIRGGSSRSCLNPKHSLRLFFSSDYGATKLRFPLFGDEGPDKFDKIDLRTEQNYSWNGDSEENKHNTFVRDIYSRDVQGLMNQPYSKGRYYHLFLNGMYWGIYQTDERTDASYANIYFGGKKSDYDVIKVSPEVFPDVNEVADGNDETWKILYNKCSYGFESNNQYFRLEGKDENGNHVSESNVLVNIDNLIDYMLLIFYTGNFDAPTSSFWGNRMPNNYYAVYNRNNNADGFLFFAHDSEHSMMVDAVYTGSGLYEDRVNIAEFDNWFQFNVEKFEDFNPQWIHYKLTSNLEYRQRFADRAVFFFNQNGLLTPDSAIAICQQRINEIDTAIIVESARWGDARQSTARTKADWTKEINVLLSQFFPYRTDIVIDQLEYAGLYYGIEAPLMLINDTELTSKCYPLSETIELTLKKPDDASGTIYYTTNGTDPRLIGGSPSDESTNTTDPVKLSINNSCIISARIVSNGLWGPMQRICFLGSNDDLSNFKLTEIHYHPLEKIVADDTLSDKDLEFIEFKNTGTLALNISGLIIDSAVNYTIPDNTIIAPGQFFVIASDSIAFGTVYGIYPSGVFNGHLANSSEQFILNDNLGNNLIDLTYADTEPWPEEADGDGYSLTSGLNNPTGDPADPAYWKSSSMLNGSPFADDTVYYFTSAKQIVTNKNLTVYPNPTNNLITLSGFDNETGTVQIFNQAGQCIYSSEITQNESVISLKLLVQKSGLYFVKVTCHSWIETRKVILIEN